MLHTEQPLELDESELFEDESGAVTMSPGSGPAAAGHLASSLHAAAAASQSDGESESDDDGIVLESECSSSEAEADDVEAELVCRIQSLQSSLEHTTPLATVDAVPLGTSHSSQVGSLKSFGGLSFKGKRLFSSDSDLAASMPVRGVRQSLPMHMHGHMGRHQVAPADKQQQTCNLGTSMPISIPMLPRRGSAVELLTVQAAEAAAARGASTFVPPHMLHRQESIEAGLGAEEGGAFGGPSLGLGLSPGGGAKREKLLARNAILRSTGFIEVQQTAVIGEVLDPVKEQLLKGAIGSASAVPVSVPGMRPEARAAPRSSLTQLLGTSK